MKLLSPDKEIIVASFASVEPTTGDEGFTKAQWVADLMSLTDFPSITTLIYFSTNFVFTSGDDDRFESSMGSLQAFKNAWL